MGSNKPIVLERPQRGREMASRNIAGQEKGKTTLMHEGYVGGAKYLVPDSDLEVMKQLVDFKLGKKPMDRYVRDYEYTHLNETPDDKFRKMSQKLQAQDTDDDYESTTSTNVEEEEEKPKKIRFEDEKQPSETSSVATEEESEKEDSRPETQESLKSDTSTATQSFQVYPSEDADRLRFLLSGHIRNNLQPIFIIHEFNGKSPFDRKPDFSSVKNEGDVDLYISGNFYRESVLEEVNNKLLSLNIKPTKIMIDDRSTVYEEQFTQLLSVGKVQIDFLGKFIKQLDTKKYTPFLSFNVQNYPVKKNGKKAKAPKKGSPPSAVYVAQHRTQNVFDQESDKCVDRSHQSVKNNSGAPKPEDNASVYEPHLKRNPSRRPSVNTSSGRRGRDAGDVGSEGGLVYNCDINRRRSSKGNNILRRLSHVFFSKH